jgi:hypothetical protein
MAGQIGRFLEISTRRLQLFISPHIVGRLVRIQYCNAVFRQGPLLYLSAAPE